MCEIINQLKFCTCLTQVGNKKIDVQKKLDKFYKKQLPHTKEPYSWVLYEFIDLAKGIYGIRGMVLLPSDEIGFNLTEEFVLNNLNNQNCFDFDYHPKEGDNLIINYERNEFFSFIFRNNQWEPDNYIEGVHKIKPKNYGIMKVNK